MCSLYFRYFYHKTIILTQKTCGSFLLKYLTIFFQKALKWFVRETCKRVEKLTGKHLYSSQWSFVGDTVAQKSRMLLGVQNGEWVQGPREETGLQGFRLHSGTKLCTFCL